MVIINRADVIALKNAINKALLTVHVSLEMQPDPDEPVDVPVQTEHGMVLLRFAVSSRSTIRFIIVSDQDEVAEALQFHYAKLRSMPGEEPKFDSSQFRHERSTGGVFAIFHGLKEGANYYVTVK